MDAQTRVDGLARPIMRSPLCRPIPITVEDRNRALAEENAQLRRALHREQERNSFLQSRVREAERERAQSDREVLQRLAPRMAQVLAKAIRLELIP